MDLIDKDSVVATIKKHIEEERHSYFCKCLLSEIDSLNVEEQPSLPYDLDEAEFEYAQSLYEIPANQEEEKMIYDAFKAGAEWMAGQGHTVDGTFHHSCGYPSVIELKTYLRDYEGADVIVQIRKK